MHLLEVFVAAKHGAGARAVCEILKEKSKFLGKKGRGIG
jgi:hypothetical protein